MSTSSTGGRAIAPLLVGLVDDAAVFPPGSATLSDAVAAHRVHRAAWYADLIGPLLLPATALREAPPLLGPDEMIEIGVIGDVPISGLPDLLAQADPRLRVRQVEAAVAKRGEDPAPGAVRAHGGEMPKCRWQALASPVRPILPIRCPAVTRAPGVTPGLITDRCEP